MTSKHASIVIQGYYGCVFACSVLFTTVVPTNTKSVINFMGTLQYIIMHKGALLFFQGVP